MNSITQNKRYCPHEITTKINSVKLYRETKDISFVCRRYHISKASLMRWNKLYDGTKESLVPKSHRPLTPHPNAHNEEEMKWICDYRRKNPNISIRELYRKLHEKKGYKQTAVRNSCILRKESVFIRLMCSSAVIIYFIMFFLREPLGTTAKLNATTVTIRNGFTTI